MGNHHCFLKRRWQMIVFWISTMLIPQASPAGTADASVMSLDEIAKSGQSCEECHEKTTPRIFREHMEGEHGKIGVSCADCHGNDHRSMQTATARFACEQCHPDETMQFLASGHSRTWENMANRVLYSSQPEVIRRNSCEACHAIGYGDDDGRCDFCHRRHSFAKKEAADPQTCAVCHLGPDHPRMEACRQSPPHFSPAPCAGCHMPAGSHNAGENLGPLRAGFIESTCSKCHDAAFLSQWLQTSAIVQEQGRQYLASGRQLLSMLRDKGRLYPDPRAGMPVAETDQEPQPGAHPFYGDTSRTEKLYFDLQKYLQEHDVQGAYHQDFQLAASEVLLAMQQQLEELQAEALLLQELSAEKVQLTPLKSFVPAPDTGDIYRLTYESSIHGVLANDRQKPSCETCHGSGDYSKPEAKDWAPVCGACHPAALVEQFIGDLAAIKDQAGELRRTADEAVAKLISKQVAARDESGNLTLLDDYKQNQGVAEVLLARLVYYLHDLDRSRKTMTLGVAHGNPDYTLWYANGAARGDLIEIRDAAAKLLRMKKVFVEVSGLPIGPLPQEN
ncbi:MAG: hypothetical protein M0P70_06445 [Desulfobulbaceae bacterium]|nr:hypothetical protein [Desulfobulbaceae bacterium]